MEQRRRLTILSATPLEMEIIQEVSDKKTLSFRTKEGYFSLTDLSADSLGDASLYYEVSEVAYEDGALTLYFDRSSPFDGRYDAVTLHYAFDEKVMEFLTGHLFLGASLRLALNSDGRNRLQ
jgi:hypothetical protein